MVVADTNYGSTIDNIEQVKAALETLDKTIHLHISQEITDKYNLAKLELLNWLNEAEYTISTYKTV